MADVPGKVTLLLALFTFVNCNYQEGHRPNTVSVTPSIGQPWPAPKQMVSTSQTFSVDAATFVFLDPKRCDILQDAFVRYREMIFGPRPAPQDEVLKFKPYGIKAGDLSSLTFNVMKACVPGEFPALESDESYALSVSSAGASITANEVWGALRGLETFSQLVRQAKTGEFMINATQISDSPRFKHRGILLDTSRHYVSGRVLKQNLDLMAQNKFNVFHWHIVDDQSFPYESGAFPNMSLEGAYDPVTHVYTQADVKQIIEHARLRGIRVVPEFDSPGHSQSWGKAITSLLTKCYHGGSWDGSYGPINPVPNATFDFLQKFFTEIGSVFEDHYIHLGGDEVSFACWQSNPDVTAFMQKMGFGTNYAKLEEYYMQRLLNIVSNIPKGYLIWQEVIDNGATVASDTVVEVWKGGYQSELYNVTSLGYKALLASCWYLDGIAYGSQWTQYYACDPYDFNGTAAQKALVIGGEACLWGEYVDDTNLISRLWPRASAVAERLWSPMSVNSTTAAAPRLEEHRCRLVRRGYPAEPANGPSFCEREYH